MEDGTTKFYGATPSKPNHRILQSAKDVVEISSSNDIEIFSSLRTLEQLIESEEEGGNILDDDNS